MFLIEAPCLKATRRRGLAPARPVKTVRMPPASGPCLAFAPAFHSKGLTSYRVNPFEPACGSAFPFQEPIDRRRIITFMPLMDQVQKDMTAAMKNREEARLSALRMVKAALMKQKVDSPKPLDEAAEMQVLKSLIKQRIDAAEMFRKGGRVEQAEKEEAERVLIESYLPAAAGEAEIEAAIAEALAETGVTSVKQMGVVMKAAQAKLKGKMVDGKSMSEKVRSRLA